MLDLATVQRLGVVLPVTLTLALCLLFSSSRSTAAVSVHFRLQPVSPARLNISSDDAMLVMTSPKKGAVVTRAATVDYTLDGGERWWRARGARNVVGLDFVDSVTGWAITAGWSSARGPVYGMLLGTRDDGKAWSALPIPSEGALVTVDFTDATTGYGVTSSGPSRAGGCRLGYYLVRGYQHGPLLHHRRRDRLVHRSCFTQLRRYPGVEHTRFRQLGRRMGRARWRTLAHDRRRPYLGAGGLPT